MSEPDLRLPSVNDPFDLKDCEQYPFPLTANEDQILKHILRITASDDQMALRAYKSIVCMWARSEVSGGVGGTAPALFGLSPDTVYTVDYNMITLTGMDFHPNCKVYKNGEDNINVTFISPTEVRSRIRYDEPSLLTIQVVNPGDLISNSLTLYVNPHPDTPRISSISPITVPKANGTVLLTINGSNFLTGCVVTKSPSIPGLWDGYEYAATLVSSTQITSTINLNSPSSAIGPNVVRVKNKTVTDHYLSYPVYLTVT